MRDLRLAWTLLRGAGGREVIRLAAMTLGVAMAVWAVLIGLAAPRAVEHAHQVAVNRAPVVSRQSAAAGGLSLRSVSVVVSNRVWTQVTVTGATADSPRPPGLLAWPAPGQTVPSTAEHARRLGSEVSHA